MNAKAKSDLYESLRTFIHDGQTSDPIVKAATDLRSMLASKDSRDERVRLDQACRTAA